MPPFMTKLVLFFAIAVSTAVLAQAPNGTVPRDSAEKYAAHGAQESASIGASLIKPTEVKKQFSTDLDSCCVAVEAAIQARNLSPANFSAMPSLTVPGTRM
jgi:hypothetical protein